MAREGEYFRVVPIDFHENKGAAAGFMQSNRLAAGLSEQLFGRCRVLNVNRFHSSISSSPIRSRLCKFSLFPQRFSLPK